MPSLLPRILLLAVMLAVPSIAMAGKQDKDLDRAEEILAGLGAQVTPAVWRSARCVSVLRIAKGGFIVGGLGGWGYLTCRKDTKSPFGAPIVQRVGGGSAGLQIGGQAVEVVMIFTAAANLDAVAHTTPVFQGNASATAGDQGAGASAGGAPVVAGGLVTVSKSKGLYAGAVGEGIVIDPDTSKTTELVGEWTSAKEILFGDTPVPPSAKGFVAAVTRWVSGKGASAGD